jgi:lipoprotein-anchoring transpeptidase ErfK/SrfK
MLKLLPLLVIISLLIAASQFTPTKRFIAYNLGISGDATHSCCEEDIVAQSNGEFDENAHTAIFEGEVVDYPKTSLSQGQNKSNRDLALSDDPLPKVLGTTTSDGKEKWIEVSLDQQMLRAWEGSNIVMEFPISSGKWFPTPKGTFEIWYKTRNQRMEGGKKELGTYYNLPNVPHNMFFYKGFAVHGAYWHNNFGHPMSHGCVNAPLDKVGALFEWTGPVVTPGKNVARADASNPGTKVFVH